MNTRELFSRLSLTVAKWTVFKAIGLRKGLGRGSRGTRFRSVLRSASAHTKVTVQFADASCRVMTYSKCVEIQLIPLRRPFGYGFVLFEKVVVEHGAI